MKYVALPAHVAERLEAPLPAPGPDYVEARLLEALAEAALAVDLLRLGATRNAAGKAFQAFKSLAAALLALEMPKLLETVPERERDWWRRAAVTVPTRRLDVIAHRLAALGHGELDIWIDKALHLHSYQYNGPGAHMELNKYSSREMAAADTVALASFVRDYAKRLRERDWSPLLEEALGLLEERLKT